MAAGRFWWRKPRSLASYDAALTLLGEITNRKLTDTVAEALYYFPRLHRKTSENSK